jgi:hypothetical protein
VEEHEPTLDREGRSYEEGNLFLIEIPVNITQAGL